MTTTRTQGQVRRGFRISGPRQRALRPLVQQDGYRRVLFGQASDLLFPAHPEPPEIPEPSLVDQALADTPEPEPQELPRPGISLLQGLLLMAIALLALGLLVYGR